MGLSSESSPRTAARFTYLMQKSPFAKPVCVGGVACYEVAYCKCCLELNYSTVMSCEVTGPRALMPQLAAT